VLSIFTTLIVVGVTLLAVLFVSTRRWGNGFRGATVFGVLALAVGYSVIRHLEERARTDILDGARLYEYGRSVEESDPAAAAAHFEECMPYLRRTLERSHLFVKPRGRVWAARTFGELKDHDAVELLIELLGDEDEKVRTTAVRSLGEIRDARAVHRLLEIFESSKNAQGYPEYRHDETGIIFVLLPGGGVSNDEMGAIFTRRDSSSH